jgi:hypothetical protein
MAIERADPASIGIAGGTEDDVNRFIESDFQIRSGLCPNGCGLMSWDGIFQQCGKCNFVCNTRPELEAQ